MGREREGNWGLKTNWSIKTRSLFLFLSGRGKPRESVAILSDGSSGGVCEARWDVFWCIARVRKKGFISVSGGHFDSYVNGWKVAAWKYTNKLLIINQIVKIPTTARNQHFCLTP